MSIERNSAGPTGIRTEDTGSGLCVFWFIVKLSYCTYILQNKFSDFSPHRSSRKSCCSVSVRDHPAHCHPPVHSPVPFTWTFSNSEDSSEASVDENEVKPS